MLIKAFNHTLMHNIATIHTILIARRSTESFNKRIIFKSSNVEEDVICSCSNGNLKCLVIDSRTFGKQILAACIDAITMEVVRLKELGPELRLGQLGRNVLGMFALHRRICLEYAINDIGSEIVFETVAAIRLRFDVG